MQTLHFLSHGSLLVMCHLATSVLLMLAFTSALFVFLVVIPLTAMSFKPNLDYLNISKPLPQIMFCLQG